ncbi:alpha/beta hydrolase-fold protein [Granulicella sp. 5B5]|uniref:alpha/beta hydrolase-fold protein n=1 Tax=Granulicella sp. 5B5 TaxID=1617967 RepID=UPI002106D30A|nr:alpha/beta hydrolase-fold protein [Granulicella sp. 5B5]
MPSLIQRSLAAFAALALPLACAAQMPLRIEVTVPSTQPLNGHLILVIAKAGSTAPVRGGGAREPRFMISETYTSAQGFGVDAKNAPANTPLIIDAQTIGYPLPNLAALPAGDYLVQAVFNKYEKFHLADGRDLWLPPDQGEGQHWNRKPGNPYNEPVRMHIDPASKAPIKLTLDKIIPPITGTDEDPEVIAKRDPEAAKYLKYMKFKSEKLSKFWGRDVYLGAWVLLPAGFDEHPGAHYPLVVYQDHFHAGSIPFNSKPMAGGRGRRGGGNVDRGFVTYQDWTNGTLPHVILLYVQNANPYYDDSYDVDSANVGPYGAAINEELIPAVEKQYRGIAQGWARATYGGSTGGWESLATQVFYPDMYNGVWSACPDPVDFHAYQNINLYDDPNAFYRSGDFGKVPVGGDRKPDGSLIATAEGEFRFEYVLGTHTRSTEQWAIWQAVFSPAGPDGYPADVLDSLTGKIDPRVVAYWHDHYDLNAYMQRNWPTLGPKLEGKIHIAVGDGDTYFLNNAVHLLQKSLDATRNPHSDAQFQYGPGEPHCYTGGPVEYTMQQNNANWLQRVLPQMTAHMIATAPKGADTRSWVY